MSQEQGAYLLDLILSPLPLDAGKEPQYLMEASDITSGKLTQQKLVEREARLRTYYEQQACDDADVG